MWPQEGTKACIIVRAGILITLLCLVVAVQVRSTASDASASNTKTTSPAAPSPVSIGSAVWVASGKTVTQIDAASHQVTQTLILNDAAIDLAVDPHTGEVWVLVPESLLKFDAQGNQILAQRLDELLVGIGEAEHVVLDPYNKTLWVGAGATLLHLDRDGQRLQDVSVSNRIKALALNLDESLWLITETELVHVSAEGEVQARFSLASLHPWTQTPLYLAVAPLGGRLWLASAAELVQLDLNDLTAAPLPITLSAGTAIRGVALDPVTGTLWLATADRLLAYDRLGNLANSVDLVAQAVKVITTLAYDPASQSLWLGDKDTLAHFSAVGEFIARTPLTSAPDALGVAAIHIVPSLALIVPAADAPTNNAMPALRLGLRTICNDSACDPGDTYRNALAVDADLNGADISGLLTRSGADITYTPTTPLPEGVNSLTAQAIDAFAHTSSVLATGFTVDTRAPQFVELNPADGSVVNNAEISIQGRVDEPATVILTHPDAETTVAGTPFAFAVTLNQEPNTFALTARDPAGNETTVSLALRLDTVPPPVPSAGLITISGPDADGKVTVTGSSGSVEAGAVVTITNTRTNESVTVIADENGAFTAQIAAQSGDTFQIVAKDPAGNDSDALQITTGDGISVAVISPSPGTTVGGNSVLVSGIFDGPANTGIIVNGIVAQVFGEQFFATVPLVPGGNVVTVTVTTQDGRTLTQSLTVFSAGPLSFEVTADPSRGLAPLAASFTVTDVNGVGIQQIDIDFDGDGTTDFTSTDLDAPIEHTYIAPGVYLAAVMVTDSQGISHDEMISIIVHDPTQLDQLFTEIWDGMNQALIDGDVSSAAAFLNRSGQRKYTPVFEALLPHMPEIISSYSPLQRVSISANIGEYAVNRTINGQNRIFLIYFLRGADGVWRLDAM